MVRIGISMYDVLCEMYAFAKLSQSAGPDSKRTIAVE
jgi:hypothetical protein